MTGVAFDLTDREVKLMRRSTTSKDLTDIENLDRPEQEDSTAAEQLLAKIETLKAERDQFEEQAKRALADSANIRRRAEQDQMKAREIATRGMLSHLVPIVDDLQRGLASMPEDEKNSAWAQGVQLIEKKLTALLEREGSPPLKRLASRSILRCTKRWRPKTAARTTWSSRSTRQVTSMVRAFCGPRWSRLETNLISRRKQIHCGQKQDRRTSTWHE